MNSVNRSFKFWGWYYAKTDALTTVLIVGIVAFTSLTSGNPFMEFFLSMLPKYLAMMVVMETIVFGFTSITVLFPMAVGMGAKRSSCIIGKAVLEHIVLIINGLIALFSFMYVNPAVKEMSRFILPLGIAAIGLLMMMGNMVSVFSNKFGRTAGMIFYIIFVVAFVFAAVAFVASDAAGTLIQTFLDKFEALEYLFAGVFLLLDIASTYILYRSISVKDLNFSI